MKKNNNTTPLLEDVSRSEKLLTSYWDQMHGLLSRLFGNTRTKRLNRLDALVTERFAEEGYQMNLKPTPFQMGMRIGLWLGGGLLTVVLIAVGLYVWYTAGGRVSIIEQIVPESKAQFTLQKAKESPRGVLTEGNQFTIVASEAFSPLAIANRVSVTPTLNYRVELQNENKTLVIVPQEVLQPETTYQVTIKQGTLVNNAAIKEDITWSFATEPLFGVISTSPAHNSEAPVDTAIQLVFSYTDFTLADVSKKVSFFPNIRGTWRKDDNRAIFLPNKRLPTGTKITVIVAKGIKSASGKETTEETRVTFRVGQTDRRGKYASLPYVSPGRFVYSYVKSPVVTFPDFSLQKAFTGRVWSLSEEGLRDVLNQYYEYSAVGRVPADSKRLKEVALSPKNVQFGAGVDLKLGKGLYLFEVDSDELASRVYWVISYSTWTVAGVPNGDAFGTWVFDSATKGPAKDVTVTLLDCGNNCAGMGNGKTNDSGFWQSGNLSEDQHKNVVMLAQKDGQTTVVLSNDPGMSSFFFSPELGGAITTQTLFDSPVYRFGDTVRYAMVARSYGRNGSYRIPQGKVELVVNHLDDSGQYSRISTQEREFNNYGVVTGETKLPIAQQSGQYFLSMRDPITGEELGSSYITVGTVAPAQYSATVSTDKAKYFNGETMNINGEITDYAGGVVAKQKIRLNIYQSKVSDNGWRENEQQIDYYSAYGEDPLEISLTTDSEGRFSYSKKVEVEGGSAQDVIGIEVTDARSNTLRTTAAAVAAKEVEMFVRPYKGGPLSEVVSPGEQIELQFASRKLWNYQPQGKVAFRFRVDRDWSERVQTGTEFDPETESTVPVYETVNHTDTFVDWQEKETNDNGVVQVALPALKEGTYDVTIELKNAPVGSKIVENVLSVFDLGKDYEEIRIWSSGEEVAPGDKVNVRIASNLANKQQPAVLAVVGRQIWHSEVFKAGEKTSYELTVTDQHFPTVNVCALYLNDVSVSGVDYGPRLEINCDYVKVSPEKYKLSVTVSPNKDTYRPGEEATIGVQVRDNQGKPVRAQVVLRGVDQSVLDSVDSYEYTQELVDTFYTYLYEFAQFSQSHSRYEIEGFGGGGGGGPGDSSRSHFDHVSLWAPQVETDADGNAQTTLRWPDSVTSWRIQADAITAANQFGSNSKNVVTTQSQYIVWEPVSHIATGDKWQTTMRVVNRDKNAFGGQLRITCTGCKQGSYSFPISVGGNSSKSVVVPLEVQAAAGSTLKVEARVTNSGNQEADSLVREITIGSGGKIVNSGLVAKTMGTDQDQILYDVEFPKDLTGAEPKLQLAISKGFFVDYLDRQPDFTVRSTQQLAQYLFYNNLIYSHYDQLKPANLSKEELARRIAFVTELLQTNQKADGGFGQFTYDSSRNDSSLLAGLAVAQAPELAGPINSADLQHYLVQIVDSASTNLHDKTMALYVLSLFKNNTGLAYASYMAGQSSTFQDQNIALGYLSAALANYGSTGDVRTLNNILKGKVNQTSESAHWQDIKTNQRASLSDKYVTSVVYLALAGSPDSTSQELMDKAVAWLNTANVGTGEMNFNQIFQFYSLFTVDSRDLSDQTVPVTVFVNNRKVGEYDVKNLTQVTVESSFLQPRQNAVRIERSRKQKLAVQTRYQFAADTLTTTEGNAFTIQRKLLAVNGSNVSKVVAGNSYRVDVSVRAQRDLDNVVVIDSLAGGMEPANLYFGNISTEVLEDFWLRNDQRQILLPQSRGTVGTFVTEMKAGRTYTFTYLVTALHPGTWQTPPSYAYSALFNELNSARTNPVLTIAPR